MREPPSDKTRLSGAGHTSRSREQKAPDFQDVSYDCPAKNRVRLVGLVFRQKGDGAMHSARTMVALAVAVILFLSLPLSWAQDQSKGTGADSAAIKQVVADFIADFNRHNAHALSMWYSEDGDFINIQAITTHGRKKIEELYVSLFAGRLGNAHRTLTVRNVRFLSPEIASVDITYELTGVKAPDGSTTPPREGFYDWTLVKQNGHWLIAILHESNIAPDPALGAPR